MAPTYHIGTNYLHDMGKRWYDWLVENGVNFMWETSVNDIDFNTQHVWINDDSDISGVSAISYDSLIYGTGKSGIDLTQHLIDKYDLKKEPKSVQVGVRMELPQKYM